jgi:hypothetical protein
MQLTHTFLFDRIETVTGNLYGTVEIDRMPKIMNRGTYETEKITCINNICDLYTFN